MKECLHAGVYASYALYIKRETRPNVTLLNSVYKVLTHIINIRIKVITCKEIWEYQCDFRKAEEKCRPTFCIHDTLQKLNDIDFKNAFDSVRRQKFKEDITQKLISLAMKVETAEQSHRESKMATEHAFPI